MKTNETDGASAAFVSKWTPCSREWFADLAKYRAMTGETPITEAILAADTGDSSLIFNLANQCRAFERQASEREALLAIERLALEYSRQHNDPDCEPWREIRRLAALDKLTKVSVDKKQSTE